MKSKKSIKANESPRYTRTDKTKLKFNQLYYGGKDSRQDSDDTAANTYGTGHYSSARRLGLKNQISEESEQSFNHKDYGKKYNSYKGRPQDQLWCGSSDSLSSLNGKWVKFSLSPNLIVIDKCVFKQL